MPEFNSIVSEEIFGSPTINQIPLEQPKSQPLNYQVPKSSVSFERHMPTRTESSNPLGDFLTKFNSEPVDLAQQIRPIGFNAESVNLKRYMNSPDFKELGIELDDSNEERYGANQSWGDVLSNGFTGLRKLAAVGFVDTWKGFGRISDALTSWDWSKLHGDAASMLELDNEIKDIMDESAIYATKQGTDTFWNRETAGNFLQQSGFAVGAALSMVSEHLITKAIEAGLVATGVGIPAAGAIEAAVDVQTVANVGRIARIMNRSKEFFDAAKNFKALKRLGDLWKEDKLVSSFIEGIGKKIPGVDIAMDMNQVWKTGKTAGISGGELAWDLTKVGVGGVKRLLSESNFAFSEARMEAAGTYSDLYSKLQADYINTYGAPASEEQLKKMSAVSMEAADKNFNFNSAVLAISNRIAFDNIFKNSKSAQNILAKYGLDEAIENKLAIKGILKGGEREATQFYTKGRLGTIGQLGKVAEDFGTKKALQVGAGSVLSNITKFETLEGVQELLQEGSNVYFQDYYTKAYQASINPNYKPELGTSLDKAIDSQLNMQGLKTFMSGALTGLILHGPTVLSGRALKYGNEKIVDYNKTKNLSPEEKIKYQENKVAAKNAVEEYYNTFNAYAKDPSTFFSEAIKNLNLQKEGSTVLDEAAKLGDKFSYENLRTDTLHGFIAASIRNNTHEALLDTLKAYGDNFSKEEFEKAFVGIEYSSENKKSASDYTSKVIGSVESYIKTWNKLQDRYGNRANPNRFKFGTKEWLNEATRKKTLNDVIELLAGNEAKAVNALDRVTSIFQKVSSNKALGTSLNSAFQILGSETNLENEINILTAEIKLNKSQLSAEGLDAEDKKKIQQQLELKETQLDYLKNWKDANEEMVRQRTVNYSLAASNAFKGYLQSKNKQAGKDITINDKDVDDHFLDLVDYIKLNDKSKQYINAINFITDEKNFTALHDRMTNGATKAYLELLGQAGIEHIKNNTALNESFILSIHDVHALYNKDGKLMVAYDTLEDAIAAKKQFDAEEKAAATEETSDEGKAKVTITVKDKEGKEHEVELIEGNKYITELEPVNRVLPNKQRIVTNEQDVITIISLDSENNKVTIQLNEDLETTTYDLQEFAEISGRLLNLKSLNPIQKLYFKNRNNKIVFNVSVQTGTLHRIDGEYANKDFTNNSVQVEGSLKLVKEDKDWVLKIEYINPVTNKKQVVNYNGLYLKKYGIKKIDLTSNLSELEYLEQEQKKREIRNYNNQIASLELLINETEDRISLRKKRSEEINEEMNSAISEIKELEETLQFAEEYLNELLTGRKTKKKKAIIEEYNKLIAELPEKISKIKETIAKLQTEKDNLNKELEAFESSRDLYYKGLSELETTKQAFTAGEDNTLYGEQQDQLNELKKNQIASYIAPERFDSIIEDIKAEQELINDRLQYLIDSVASLEKVLERLLQYDDLIKTISKTGNQSAKSLDNLRNNLAKLKYAEANKKNPNKEKLAIINQMLSGLNGKLKTLQSTLVFNDVLQTLALLNEYNSNKQEFSNLLERGAQLQDKFDEYTIGREQANKILSLQERVDFLKNIQAAIKEGYAKFQAKFNITQTSKSVTGITKQAASEFAEYNNIMSSQPIIIDEGTDADDIFITDYDKPLLIEGGLFKTAGRHYDSDTDENPTSPQAGRFFKFSESITLDGTYYFMPISADNDIYGITQKEYEDEKGRIISVSNDIKLVVVKKVKGEFKFVGVDGKVLEELPTKDNIVYTSLGNNPTIVSGTDKEVLEYLKGTSSPLTVKGMTDEAILQQVKVFRGFRNNILSSVKDNTQAPLQIVGKSKGKQKREPLDVQTNLPQELPLEGRLIENNPNFDNLKHPDGSEIKLSVVTTDTSAKKGIKVGRIVSSKINTFTTTDYQVYNRQLTFEEKDNLFEVLYAFLPLFGRRNAISDERKNQLKDLFDEGKITSEQLVRLTTKLTTEEEKQFDLALKYLMNTVYWRQPGAGEKVGKKQFYIKGDSLFVGENEYKFEVDGTFTLDNIKAAKDEITDKLYHNVNNNRLNNQSKKQAVETAKVVDGKIVVDKSFKNYLEYLLSDKIAGHTPIIYTNIIPYAPVTDINKPQLKNVYLKFEGPKESIGTAPEVVASTAAVVTPQTSVKAETFSDPSKVIKQKGVTILFERTFKDGIKREIYTEWNGEKFVITKIIRSDGKEVSAESIQGNQQIIDEFYKNVDDDYYSEFRSQIITDFKNLYPVIKTVVPEPTQTNAAPQTVVIDENDIDPETGDRSFSFSYKGATFHYKSKELAEQAYADKVKNAAATASTAGVFTPTTSYGTPTGAPITTATGQTDEDAELEKAMNEALEAQKSSNNKGNYRLSIPELNKELENIEEAKAELQRMLPQIGFEVASHLIDGRAMGQFINGIIQIYKYAGKGTAYHETFEAVWNSYLSEKQRNELITEFQNRKGEFTNIFTGETKEYKKATPYDVKEMLAEEFIDYARSEKGIVVENSPKRNTIFRTIFNFIKKIWNGIQEMIGLKSATAENSKIVEVFSKLYQGKYANKESLYDDSSINPPAFRATLTGTNVEFTQKLMEGMAGYFFIQLYRNENNVKALFDNSKPELFNKLYSAVINQVNDDFNNVIVDFKDKALSKGVSIDKIKEKLKTDSYFVNQLKAKTKFNTEVKDLFKTYLSQFGLEFKDVKSKILDEDIKDAMSPAEIERNDTLGIVEAIYIDPRDAAKTEVKILIASLTKDTYNKEGVTRPAYNEYGLPQLEDYGRKMNILLNELHGITPLMRYDKALKQLVEVSVIDQMFNKLDERFYNNADGEYKPGYEWIARLKRGLAYETLGGEKRDISTLNKDEISLLMGFEASFTNNRNNPTKLLMGADGIIFADNTLDSTNEKQIRETWKNNIKADAKEFSGTTTAELEKGPFVYIDNNGNIKFNILSKEFKKFAEADTFDEILNELRNLGITFTASDNDIRFGVGTSDIIDKFGSILDQFKKGNINTFEDLFGNQVVNGPINYLVSVERKFTSDNTVLSVRNAEGKQQYSITLPSAVSHIVNSLNNSKTITDFVASNPQYGQINLETGEVELNPFTRNSLILKEFFDEKGNKNRDAKLEYRYILGAASQLEAIGTSTDRMEFPDKVVQEVFHILDNTYYTVINSDKSSEFGLNISGIPFLVQYETIDSDTSLEGYKNNLRDELATALFESKNKDYKIQYYSDTVSELGNLVEIIKLKTNLAVQDLYKKYLNSEISEDEFVNNDVVETLIKNYIESKVDETIDWFVSLGLVEIKNGNYVTNMFSKEQIASLSQAKIPYKDGVFVSQNDFRKIIKYINVNRQLMVFEQHKLLFGHPALYKDLAKRSSGINSQKQVITENSGYYSWMDNNMQRFDGKERTNTFRFISHTDPIIISKFNKSIAEGMYKNMKESFVKKDGTISKANKSKIEDAIGAKFNDDGTLSKMIGNKGTYMEGYLKANEPDGGAYIMPDFFRDMHFLSGKLSDEQNALLEYENANEILDRSNPNHPKYDVSGFAKKYTTEEKNKAKEIVAKGKPEAVLQVLKPQGFGYQNTKGLTHTTFLKHSVVPLTWSRVVATDAMLSKYIQAQNDQIDIIGFESGEKVGVVLEKDGRTIQPLYNENGGVNEKLSPVQEMYTKYYGFQVEMASYSKDDVIFGTQMRKINLSNLPKELRPAAEEYNRLLESLTSKEFSSVLKELGLVKREDGSFYTDNLDRMVETLRVEIERRDLPDNIMDMLYTVDGKLAYPLDSSPIRDKLESILNAIVDNRILGQKMSGKPSVQIPATMFEKSNRLFTYLDKNGIYVEGVVGSELTKEQRKNAKMLSSDLNFPTLDKPYMEVLLPNFFKELFKDGQEINIAELDPRLLQVIGFRIPTQSMAQIANIRIAGFLDPQWGDMIVVPSEIVAQAGSDFDIDKLNLFLANYYIDKKTGKPTYIEYSTSDAEIEDRYTRFINESVDSDTKSYVKTLERYSGDRTSLQEKYGSNKDDIFKKFNNARQQYDDQYENSKKVIFKIANDTKSNDDTIKAYKAEGLKLFKTLPLSIKQPFYDLKDEGVLSVAENKAMAERLLQANPDAKYASTLMQMIQYHEAMLDVYGQINSWTDEQLNSLADRANTALGKWENWKEANLEKTRDEFLKSLKEQRLEYTKELARVGGFLSLEEFKALPIEEQNSKKANQNRLIELMSSILSHPENYRQVVVPNGSSNLEKIAEDIRELKRLGNTEKNKTALSEFKNMAEIRERYITGKKLVGVIALQITSHSLSQYGDVTLEGIYKDGDDIKNIKINLDSTTNEGKFMLNLIEDKGYQWISELLSEAMTGAVDAAKNPFIFDLNLTLKTASTWFYLQKLGVPVRSIAYMFNQPIILKYTNELSKNESLLNDVNGNKLQTSKIAYLAMEEYLEKAIPKFKETLGIRLKGFTGIADKSYKSIVLNSEKPGQDKIFGVLKKIIKEEISKLNVDAKFSEEELKSMIKPAESKLSKEEAVKQIQILLDYLEYKKQAGYLDNFIRALSYDTSRTKNIGENELQKAVYNTVAEDDNFITKDSLKRVFGDTFLKSLKEIKDNVPEMFRNYFITLHPKARPTMQKAIDLINKEKFMSKDDKILLLNRFQNFFLTYLLHTGEVTINNKTVALKNYYKGMFMGDNSIAKQLKKYQKEYPENKALKSLFGIINSDRKDTDNVKLMSNKLNTYETNSISESLVQLYDTAVKENNEDLISFINNISIFIILQSGLQQSPINYAKILPIDFYSKVVGSIFNNFDKNENFQVDPETVWRQFHQNNYKNQNLIDVIKEEKISYEDNYDDNFGDYIGYDAPQQKSTAVVKYFFGKKEFVCIKSLRPEVAGNKKLIEELVKRKEWDKINDYALYQRVGEEKEDGASPYILINKLGNGMYLTETSVDPYAKSILNKNGNVDEAAGLQFAKEYLAKEADKELRDELIADTSSSTQSSTSVDEFTLADKLTPIEQNFADGQGGRQMQSQFKGKSTMDLIISGDRTRTTRAKTDIQRMAKDYNLSKISDLVGKVIRMTDKTGRQVYTRITKVAPFTQEYQDATWQKEGWIKAVTDKNVGDYPYAIEFEVINKPTQQAQTVSGINEPKGEKVKEGIYVNQEGLSKEEQLELFDYLKPFLESQGKKTNMGPSAPIMIGLNLRWDYKRNNPEKTPVNIGKNLAGGGTSYAYYDLSIDGKPLGKITPRFVELMNKSTGIDISNYDGAIINLYTNGSLIGNHSDLEESATAEQYPVVVANIGGSGNIILGTGANKTSVNLKAGAGYLFGFEGKNRKIPHSTYASEVKGFLPAITVSQEGKTFNTGSYRVSITMRRVMPLEPGMPTSPNIISQPTQAVNTESNVNETFIQKENDIPSSEIDDILKQKEQESKKCNQ
jgi:hypothetical protein